MLEKLALEVQKGLEAIPLHWRLALIFDVLMAHLSIILYGLAIQGADINPDGWLFPIGCAFWATAISGGVRYYNHRQSLRRKVSVWDR